MRRVLQVPLTILLLVSTLARGGPMHVLMSLLRHLDPARYRAVVVTLSPEPKDSLIEEVSAMGIAVEPMQLSRPGSVWAGVRTLRKLAAAINPDLVHTHGLRADFLAARAELACPTVATLHCDLKQDYSLARGRVAGTVLAAAHHALLRRLDGVAAVAESVAEAALHNGVKARVIPNGVEIDAFHRMPDPGRRAALRVCYGWPAGAMVVLHTGSLSTRKNPLAVLKGFLASALASRGLLVFAGDGPLREQCASAAGSKRNVLFLGKRRDIPDLLEAADVLVSSSAAEGLPMAVLEGCASGIRVLASDIPPHRSIHAIFPDQVQLVDGWEQLRNALDGMAQSSEHRRFAPSPEALEQISSTRMSGAYQEFYQSLLRWKSFESASSGEAVRCQ
jgi:glycosyltransferase involved in cell wall biosynthesis